MRRLRLLAAAVSLAAPLALLAPAPLRCAPSNALGGTFNDIGDGTRPLGMGGAFVALADDANASTENPAGMGFFDRADHFATFTHSDLFNSGELTWTQRSTTMAMPGFAKSSAARLKRISGWICTAG